MDGPLVKEEQSKMFPSTRPMPGIIKVLHHLYKNKISMAIATSCTFKTVAKKTDHLQVRFIKQTFLNAFYAHQLLIKYHNIQYWMILYIIIKAILFVFHKLLVKRVKLYS